MPESTKEQRANWLRRIKSTFTGSSGWSAENVVLLHDMERLHFEQLFKQREGYATLMDAFLDFSMLTISTASRHTPQPSAYRFAFFIASFHRFRASYNNYWDGYYSEAASHLRALFENLLNYGAVLNGYISEQELFEFPQSLQTASSDLRKCRQILYKHHVGIARRVQKKMIGSDSSLSQNDQRILEDEVGLLHSHVHRASAAQLRVIMDTFRGVPITYFPQIRESYANKVEFTTIYAAWAFTRILPFISDPSLFTQDWKTKFSVLDNSFIEMVDNDASTIDETFSRFIKTKMNFIF